METAINPVGSGASAAVGEPGQYLTFQLQGELFAVGILNLREIIEFGELTEVPMMPSCIRGVINLRGRVVPVVDLSARFGRPATQVSRRTSIVIFESAAAQRLQEPGSGGTGKGHNDSIGIMVDSVNEVVEIAPDEIEPPPDFGGGIRASFINGMARQGSKFVIVLNLREVLSLEELQGLGRAAADQSATASRA